MLDNTVQDALLRLTQREGRAGRRSVDPARAAEVVRLLEALPVQDAGMDARDCDCPSLARAILALADVPEELAQNVVAVVSACGGDRERAIQANAMVGGYVRGAGHDWPARAPQPRLETPRVVNA